MVSWLGLALSPTKVHDHSMTRGLDTIAVHGLEEEFDLLAIVFV